MLRTEQPTDREKHFDSFILKIIKDGINSYDNKAVYIENNRQGMSEFYKLIHYTVPAEDECIRDGARLIYENKRSYAITDEALYKALKQLSAMERQLLLKYYWDNTKIFSLANQMKVPMTVLRKTLYAAVGKVAETLSAREV